MKQIIIAILGESGSGKTTLSKRLKDRLGIPYIVSYTQRPKRPSEVDGIDHYFTTSEPPEEVLAFTVFGGYKYWAIPPEYLISSYVIDEIGLRELAKSWSGRYELVKIKLSRPDRSDIDSTRKLRDIGRDDSDISYDIVLENSGSLQDLEDLCVSELTKYFKKL